MPRLNHLARTVCRSLLSEAAEIHDLQTRSVFSSLLSCDHLSDSVWWQASLLIRLGGFGLSSVKSVSPCAFLGSWVQALVYLPIRFPNLKSFIDSFLASPSEFPTGIVLSSLIPAASKLSDYLPENNKLQKRLFSELAESSLNNVLKASVLMRDAAHFCSLTGKGAGAWISAVPSSACFAIDSCVYRLVCMLRLGLPVCSSKWLSLCECGAALDDTAYHLSSCKFVGGPIWCHISIAGVWTDCLRELHLPCRREPRHRYSKSEDRPDIVSLDQLIWISRWHTHGVVRSSHHLLKLTVQRRNAERRRNRNTRVRGFQMVSKLS